MTAYSNLKSMFLSVNGYHPFSPDAGIFAGGYQGPLYPNPTKLIAPELGFNPLPYQNPIPSNYTMATSEDIYNGLGIANPGINYVNPGHIFGIFDTFNRMSYGLNILKASRDLSTGSDIGPSVVINIPLLDYNFQPLGTMNDSNIYPLYSEKPDKYIQDFISDGELFLDPRTDEPFIFENPHVHTTTLIDLLVFFANVGLSSYYNLPELFQQYIRDMVTFANSINIFSQNRDEYFTHIPLIHSPEIGTLFNEVLEPLLFFPSSAPRITSLFNNPVDEPLQFGTTDDSLDAYTSKFEILNREQALRLMTGENNFHKVSENQYEYRSLTELNSVISILPIQTHAFQWEGIISSLSETSNPLGFTTAFFSVSYTDVILNIIGNTGITSVIINGSVRMIKEKTDGSANTGPFLIAPAEAAIQRNIGVYTSHTNLFTWDRKWFGEDIMPMYNEKTQNEQNYEQSFFTGPAPDTVTIPITQFDFSNTFQLKPGNNCIRFRLVTQNIATHFVLFETTVIDLNTSISSLPNHYVVITNPTPVRISMVR